MKKEKFLEKIAVSVGVGKMRQQPQFEEKILPEVMNQLAIITGQKPCFCPAKKAIAGFKTREGDVVGLKITLRRKRMEDFFSRLVNIVIPRIKDFRGLDLKNVDENGNLNIGIRDVFAFPEIEPEKVKFQFGLQITIVPLDKHRERAIEVFRKMGTPLKM